MTFQMKLPMKFLLTSFAIAAVSLLPSCVVEPGRQGHRRAVVYQAGIYDQLPAGYLGSYYWRDGRYYYGGRYELGRYRWHGRNYDHRYYHDGRYYYGGRYYRGRD